MNRWCFVFYVSFICVSSWSDVVINEFMYHASDSDLEYVELYNTGDEPVDLTGWSIRDDQDEHVYLIKNQLILSARHYAVIANNPTAFQAAYSRSADSGGFSFGFANSGDSVRLYNSSGQLVEAVTYDDRQPWSEQADGNGSSLERIHPLIPAHLAQAWKESESGGTPGQRNSAYSEKIPPIITSIEHFPKIPGPNEIIRVTATVLSLQNELSRVQLYYGWNETPRWRTREMYDDGQHQDGQAGDGVFGTEVPGGSLNGIFQFYVEATDSSGMTVTLPVEGSRQPYLAIVENPRQERVPIVRVVMLPSVRQQFLNRYQTDEYFPASLYEGDTAYYNVHIRHRGRSRVENGRFKIRFPHDNLYRGNIRRLNLNGTDNMMILKEYLSFQLYQDAGLPNLETFLIRFHINGEPTRGTPYRVAIENPDAQFLRRKLYFDNEDGNLYKTTLDGTPNNKATWRYIGDDPDLYDDCYVKQTNEEEADYSDIIRFSKVLTEAHPHDADFVSRVYSVLNVDEFLRWMAVSACVAHWDSPFTDHAHNYILYHDPDTNQFNIIAWDLNGTFRYSTNPNDINYRKEYTHIRSTKFDAINKILNHPYFGTLYYREIEQLMNMLFSPEAMDDRIDAAREAIGASRNSVNALYSYVRQRNRDLKEWMDSEQGVSFISKPVYQAYVGEWYEYKAVAVNYRTWGNVSYQMDGAPAWLNLDEETGLLSGIPSEEGEYEIHITAQSEGESIEQSFTLQVTNALPRLIMNFNGTSSDVQDLSSFQNHGQIQNLSRRREGRFGEGLYLNRRDGYVRIPNDPSLDLSGSITVEAWIRPTSLGNGNTPILLKGNEAQFNYNLMLGYGPFSWDSMEPCFMPHPFDIENRVYYGRKEIQAQLRSNVWVHLAGTYDSAQEKVCVYLNNYKIVESANRSRMPVNSNDLFIGLGNGNGFQGTVDDVKILPFAKEQFAAGLSITQVEISNLSPAQDRVELSLATEGQPSINTADFCLYRVEKGQWISLPAQELNSGAQVGWWLDELGVQEQFSPDETLALYPITSIGTPSRRMILDQVVWGDHVPDLDDAGVQAGVWLPGRAVKLGELSAATLRLEEPGNNDEYDQVWLVIPGETKVLEWRRYE